MLFNPSLHDNVRSFIHLATKQKSMFMKEMGDLYKETEPGTYRGHIQDTFNTARSQNILFHETMIRKIRSHKNYNNERPEQ